MKAIITSLLILVILLAGKAEQSRREKRWIAIYEFSRMIKCTTHRSPLSYNRYGCWCGRGGSGKIVDATDRCCYEHDMCYKSLVNSGTCGGGAWWWTNYKRSGCNGCSLSNSGCGAELCYCDQTAARCFSRASFNTAYENYDKGKC
ncbi:phospholipase A2 A2-actitoxin-Cgg2a-like [Paramuricea clavata]|uniref:Phospholipase A2 n=1 Tax=Paramuricea clavata TaxID=317549 RepID=A0A6S7GT29_PARCT|nr:phospholipase A2 A2-actitoxin-Cgg2a-like [Paramuricea clavata]